MKKKIIIFSIISALSFLLGQHVGNKVAESQEKIHQEEIAKLKESVRIETRIIVKKDGTQETVIIEEREKEETNSNVLKSEKKISFKKQWSVGLSAGGSGLFRGDPIYTLSVDRRVLGELFVGLYGRSDKELGLNLKYQF